MKVKCMIVKCLTNMHVGSGDTNFNIIDNEVQKDSVTGLPTVNSSGIKGALREFFEKKYGECDENTVAIFGSPSSKTDESNAGRIKFLQANAIAIPMRSSDKKATYYLTTNTDAIEAFNQLSLALGTGKKIELNYGEDASVEGV